MEGNIIVDGVLASCYPSADHDLAHISMAPMQWFPGFTEFIFGFDNEMQAYVYILNDLWGWVSPNILQ